MASFVTVVDASARRVKVKTTPAKSLSEILQEACREWRFDASRHGLKYNSKVLDLSRTIRLSGLSSGAKLELVKISKTPSAISVALQLPASEKDGIPNGRMTDKFSSSVSLWQILRGFESATAGGLATQKNFTGRGVPLMANGESGAGRLYYEGPVLQIMGKEYSSLPDLQKSLSQLGFNDGSVLLRLTFRPSSVPLEQAQKEVEDYFNTLENIGDDSRGTHAGAVGEGISASNITQPGATDEEENGRTLKPKSPGQSPQQVDRVQENAEEAAIMMAPLSEATIDGQSGLAPSQKEGNGSTADPSSLTSGKELGITGPDGRPIAVFAPSSSSTPKAALQPHNEADYEPSIAQHKRYQAHLGQLSQQQRLPSDKEIEDKQKAQTEKLTNIKQFEIKVRLPNEYSVVASFSNLDTSTTLYDLVRHLLENENEPFTLRFTSTKGPKMVPKDSTKQLVSDLGMAGRTLVNFIWDEGASMDARNGSIIKAWVKAAAQELDVPEVVVGTVEDIPNLGWGRLEEGRSQGNGKAKGTMTKLLGHMRKK